jgi:hypothetical protein
MRAWFLLRDPELVAAADEVDASLTLDRLSLPLLERVRRGAATARWVGEFRRASR